MGMRALVLLGGGHAHVHVLARAAREPIPNTEIVLISPFERHHYSGMVPGFLQGTYEEPELAFDLPALAARAGARFVKAWAERIDVAGRFVEAGGEKIHFDLLSVDVGSEAAGLDVPGAREHAFTVRPMTRAIALRARADELFVQGAAPSIAIVGGGAAGVEVALALERRGLARGARPVISLVEAGAEILAGFSARVRSRAKKILAARGVTTRLSRRVTSVSATGITLDDGARVPSDLTVWLAGAAAPKILAASDVPKDARGYLLVDSTLRAVDGSPLFGAGDCISLEGHPEIPKAGVYAVRESPVLDENLRATLSGAPPRRYVPQRTYLALMNTADGRAILRWHGFVGHSRLAWLLKDRIDRGFMRRYQEGS